LCVQCLNDTECTADVSSRCNPVSHLCVGCTENSQCEGESLCDIDRGGVCVQCLSGADCPSAFPACETTTGSCKECLTDAQCPLANRARCETVAGNAQFTCVECTGDGDCTNPGASRCVGNACVACQGNEDCSHLDPNGATTAGGTGVCDVGTCVECTGLQRDACGINVCDSLAKTCTNRTAGLAGLCDECVSDAECAANARCVSQAFEGTPIGNFCVPVPVAGSCNSLRPYFGSTSGTTLDSVVPVEVCVLRATTCPGLNAQSNACEADTDCGADGIADGVCVAFGDGSRCTTQCSSDNDCDGDCIQTNCAL
jgi:hypothetical protein